MQRIIRRPEPANALTERHPLRPRIIRSRIAMYLAMISFEAPSVTPLASTASYADGLVRPLESRERSELDAQEELEVDSKLVQKGDSGFFAPTASSCSWPSVTLRMSPLEDGRCSGQLVRTREAYWKLTRSHTSHRQNARS